MSTQKYANLAQSLLATGYTAGNTTLTVTTGEGSLFPSTGDFIVAIDVPPAFFLKCTSRTGDVLTVSSTGQEGTTAVNKASGIKVTQVLTAGSLDALRSDISQVGTFANLPTVAKAGDTYLQEDGPYTFIYTGSVWEPILPHFGKVTLPVSTGGSWINQASATLSFTKGYGLLTGNASATDQLSLYTYSLPATPYTVTLLMRPLLMGVNYNSCGLALTDGTKIYFFSVFWDQSNLGTFFYVTLVKWTNATTGAAPSITVQSYQGDFVCLKINDDGTNLNFIVSIAGVSDRTVFSEAHHTFLTATSYGFAVNSRNATYAAAMQILSITAA